MLILLVRITNQTTLLSSVNSAMIVKVLANGLHISTATTTRRTNLLTKYVKIYWFKTKKNPIFI